MRTTIVLVHGAFAESASWDGVIEPLVAEGHRVVAAPNPLRGLAADAASVSDIVRTIEGPVMLVAHSYGGAVISNVDRDAGEIVGLVYVNGFAPDSGENCFGSRAACSARKRCGRCRAATQRPTSTSPRTASTTSSARTSLRRRPPSMAATQRPATRKALVEPSGEHPLWNDVPAWFLKHRGRSLGTTRSSTPARDPRPPRSCIRRKQR
jgi:pimeloyl-ACP methyl ester carboxylesterase